ncbi:DsbA family protein [Streptomyces sp. NBC_01497]|uniref:DsbA family protein n=1 Tax=Streptomyces sp. NBC_01497 TaxID=2903885 RepID=UPI002E36FB95|nr:DsbA family protein [Streptomyces sp. NBC_01497]
MTAPGAAAARTPGRTSPLAARATEPRRPDPRPFADPAPVRQPATGAELALTVTEFTDPACPWAWGSEPALRLLGHTLGPLWRWRRVFGILFDEDDDEAPDPSAEARWYDGFIREVAAHTGAPYPEALRWLTRSSWPASAAAKAAETQGREVGERVLRRLRESTFVHGTPADTADGIRWAVTGVPGLDVGRLMDEAASAATRAAVAADRAQARRPIAEVVGLDGDGPHPGGAKELARGRRYALPTLLFEGPGGRVCAPGWQSFDAFLAAAGRAAGSSAQRAARPSASAALERWRSLSGPELALLTREQAPPRDAVRIRTAGGPLWLHPAETAARSAGR